MNKEQIAQEFVGLHKDFDVAYNGGFEHVYAKLLGGDYGEARVEEIFDGSHEIQVEVSGADSKSGSPVIFSWVDDEYISEHFADDE